MERKINTKTYEVSSNNQSTYFIDRLLSMKHALITMIAVFLATTVLGSVEKGADLLKLNNYTDYVSRDYSNVHELKKKNDIPISYLTAPPPSWCDPVNASLTNTSGCPGTINGEILVAGAPNDALYNYQYLLLLDDGNNTNYRPWQGSELFLNVDPGNYILCLRRKLQGSGNSWSAASCEISLSISDGTEDTEVPTIVCPPDITLDDSHPSWDEANCQLIANIPGMIGLPTGADNCTSSANLIFANDCPPAFPKGETVVNWWARDEAGNISLYCSHIVTVKETTPPVADLASLPDLSGDCDVTIPTPTATDNCSGSLLGVPDFIDFTDEGDYTITWTYTDECGNTSTQIQNVTIEDLMPPIAKCNSSVTVYLNPTSSLELDFALLDNGSSDNCAIVSSSISPQFVDCDDVSIPGLPTNPVNVTLMVYDAHGNDASCVAEVIVYDNCSPKVVCQNIDVFLDENGAVSIDGDDVTSQRMDNCSIASETLSQSSFNCDDAGETIDVVYSATDPSGNISSCTAEVSVYDMLPPTALCQDYTAYLDANGTVSITESDIDNSSFDNCEILSYSLDLTSFDCDLIGDNDVVLTVNDVNGNSSTCSAIVTVLDIIPPTITCPSDVSISADQGACASSEVSLGNPQVADNCSTEAPTNDGLASYNVGNTTVTWIVLDPSNNSASCTQNVEVLDQENPVAICQNLDVILDASGEGSLTALQVNSGSTDNCDIESYSIDMEDFTCSYVGLNNVTLTVLDVNGNSSTCTAEIRVIDNIAPSAVCQNITIELDASGNASISAGDIDNGSSDACGIADLSLDNENFNCDNIGSNTVILTVTDNNNNSSTCSATVTVEDNVDPTAVCQDITVQVGTNGEVSIDASQIDNGSSDACGIDEYELDISSFTCDELGANTVELTVTDNNGNSSSCSATVTVVDNINPTAIAQNIDVILNASGVATIDADDIDNGSFDNCIIDTKTIDISEFDCDDIDNNPIIVTLTVTDGSNNSSVAFAQITVIDNEDPVAICQNLEVLLDPFGSASITALEVDNGSNDACEIADYSLDINTFSCDVLGANPVVLTVTDNNSNTASCDATITVINSNDPTIECLNPTVYLDANGEATITESDVVGGAGALCDEAPSISFDPVMFDCSDLDGSPIDVLVTIVDAQGNETSCTSEVTVLDNIPPSIECPSNVEANNDAGICSASGVELGDATADDNCTFTVSNNSLEPYSLGDNNVIWTAVDGSGNEASCTQIVTVIDNESPVADIANLPLVLEQCEADLEAPTATDNCDGTIEGVATETVFTDQGEFTVTWTYTDASGNNSSQDQDVKIQDLQAPIVVCNEEEEVYMDENGFFELTPDMVLFSATDNCGIDTMFVTEDSLFCDNVTTDPNNPLFNTITATVIDFAGNESTCECDIIILDKIAPVANCKYDTLYLDENGSATLLDSDIDGGSYDNCSISSYELSQSEFDCSDAGQDILVFYDIFDPSGNTSRCGAEITVYDTLSPIVICQDITVELDADGLASISPSDIDNGSTDNCEIELLSIDLSDFDCDDLDENTVTLTALDVNGNSSSCTAVVTVVDVINPTIVCAPTVEVNTDLDLCSASQVQLGNPDTDDNCSIVSTTNDAPAIYPEGTTEVTWTTIDQSGNEAQCIQEVIVTDAQAPNAICQDITVGLDFNGNATIIAEAIDGGSTDNCEIEGYSASQLTFDCSHVGSNNVILSVVDASGNEAMCNANIVVIDTTAVSGLCFFPAALQLDANGELSITPSDLEFDVFDACGIADTTLSQSDFSCEDVGTFNIDVTFEDVNGNFSVCTIPVTIEDNVAPNAICQDITIELDANGQASIETDDIDNGSSDACGIAAYELSQYDFTCDHIGSGNVVELTVTDINGNSASCAATVTVKDIVAPNVITQNITIQLDENGSATILPEDVDNGSTDACGIEDMVVDRSLFNCADVAYSPIEITLTVTDVNGNSSSAFAYITVEDNVAPEVICQDIVVMLNPLGMATITADQIDNGSNDACGGLELELDITSFNCDDIGNNTVTLTVTDENGNSASCSAIVVVENNNLPSANCMDFSVELNDDGLAVISPADIDNMSSATCGIASIVLDQTEFNCDDLGDNEVLVTVTDNDGNVSTCTANVTVEDNIDPTILCPADVEVFIDAGTCQATNVELGEASADDNCSFTISNDSQEPYALGDNEIVWTAIDPSGNEGTCIQIVTVIDNEAPVPTLASLPTVIEACSVELVAPTALDNCDGEITGTADVTFFDEQGTYTVTWSFEDNSGNVSTQSQEIIIEDLQAPSVVCNQELTQYLDESGIIELSVGMIEFSSSDNCGIESSFVFPTSLGCDDVSTDPFNLDPVPVTLTVIDFAGNESSCVCNLIVLDKVAPTAICKRDTLYLDEDGSAILLPEDIDNGSFDNCSIFSTELSQDEFDCDDVNILHDVTYSISDPSNNTSYCIGKVLVLDELAPEAICQDITVQLDADGLASISPSDVDNGSSDNCGIETYEIDLSAFDCNDIGDHLVTLTLTDVNGNVSSCTSTVTVEDAMNPEITCPADLNIFVDAGECSASDVNLGLADASDNCAMETVENDGLESYPVGTTVVTWTATDQSGNAATCEQMVTVTDNIAPEVMCQDIVIALDANGSASISPSDIDNGSTDNCEIASYELDIDAFDCSMVGDNAVSLTVTDIYGNSASCSATVTVEDNIAPAVICQDFAVELDSDGLASISPSDIDNGSSDNCEIESYELDIDAFDCSMIGDNLVTLTVTDVNGNSASCSANVVVSDNMAPEAICMNITVELDENGLASISPSDVDNGSSDNCEIESYELDIDAFDCDLIGDNDVVLTITDVNGNSSSCSAIVTVEDNLAPVISTQDITVELDSDGLASISPSDLDNGSSDNCEIDEITISRSSFDCADVAVSPIEITFTVTDVNGNSSSAFAYVTVEDNMAPEVICQDISLMLDENGLASIAAVDIDNGSNDNCGIASYELDIDAFDCSMIGDNLVTLTVTDVNGNSASCSANVVIEDNLAPIVSCQDFAVELDANGEASISPSDIDNGSSDNCEIEAYELDIDAFDCSMLGDNLVTLTVTDVNGNSASCSANVVVSDNMAPEAICMNITVELDEDGLASISPSDIDNGSSDNCEIEAYELDIDAFDCSMVGDNAVVLTVTDVNGNSSSCSAIVTVEDNLAPEAICQDLTVYLDDAGSASIVAEDLDNGSTDNCGIESFEMDNDGLFNCDDANLTATITLTVTDVNNNASTCTSDVLVLDTISPVVECQPVAIVLDEFGFASTSLEEVLLSAEDNCEVVTTFISQEEYTCEDAGVQLLVVTAIDPSGNEGYCLTSVFVADTLAPDVVCQDITVELNEFGHVTIDPADLDGGSTDNCSFSSQTASQTFFDCSNIGANNVTYIVTDDGGNIDSCVAIVTVVDNIAPVAICQDITIELDANGTASITSEDLDYNCSDNCLITNAVVSMSEFDCSNLGANSVTLTVTDLSGNVGSCTSTVTVQDNLAPSIICPADVSMEISAGSCEAMDVILGDASAEDNCSIASISNDAPEAYPIGETVVTWTAVDASGNMATCTQLVTIIDNEAPSIVCPADIVIPANAGLCYASPVDLGTPTFSDNCSGATVSNDGSIVYPIGTTIVTWTVVDAYGNEATCEQSVTVEDTQMPSIICPNDITLQASSGDCAAIDVDLGTPITFDNCSLTSVSNDAPSSFLVGITVVTWSVEDNAGNISTCTQTISVEDNTLPTIVCPADLVISADLGSCEATSVDLGDADAADDCSIASISNDAPEAYPLGLTVVTWTVVDESGNEATCTQSVLVEDNEAPSIVCADAITVTLSAGECEATDLDLGAATATDNCELSSLSNDAPAAFGVGTTIVTWMAIDVAGNSVTCEQTVIVEDLIAPTITCGDEITISTDLGQCSASNVDLGMPDAQDNCSIESITNDAPETYPLGSTMVTWAVTDQFGNAATCEQLVTVFDNEAPTSADLADILASCEVLSLEDPAVSDNCSSIIAISNDASFPITSSVTVEWTYEDEYGNIGSAFQNVVIDDSEAPIADIASLDEVSAECEVTSLTAPTATDNCAGSIVGTTDAILPISESTTITWEYIDASGNISVQTQIITIDDAVAPIAIGQDLTLELDENGNASVTAEEVDNGSSDNCGIVSYELSQTSFDSDDIGDNTVTLTVTDAQGNESTVDVIITIEDLTPPVPAALQLEDVEADCSLDMLTDPEVTDNSGDVTITNDAIYPITASGLTVVTWTYTDNNGNVTVQTQNVIIEDHSAPVPDLATLPSLDAVCSITSLTPPTATDECSGQVIGISNVSLPIVTEGTTFITWIFEDESGNIFTQTQEAVITGIDASVSVDGGTISTTLTGMEYQWMNCETGDVIDGATASTYTPAENGTYAVTITTEGCSETSECVTIANLGLELHDGISINIYPNPSNIGYFKIDYNGNINSVQVMDMLGRTVVDIVNPETKTIDVNHLMTGKYLVKIKTSNGGVSLQPIIISSQR